MPDIFVSSQKSKHRFKAEATNISTQAKNVKGEIKETRILQDGKWHKLPGHNHNPFASYCYYPDGVRFINEDPEEKVILLLRRHPITNLFWICAFLLMITLPAFVSGFDFISFFPVGYRLILALVWYLITIAFLIEKFLKWIFNVNIVTDERIIEVDFVGLLYREITDANIDQIQDVTVPIGGGPRTVFNYGDVIIQTASEVPRIVFEAVPKPDLVAKVLRELRVEEEKEKLEGRVR